MDSNGVCGRLDSQGFAVKACVNSMLSSMNLVLYCCLASEQKRVILLILILTYLQLLKMFKNNLSLNTEMVKNFQEMPEKGINYM